MRHGAGVSTERANDSMVVAYLGAAGLQATPADRSPNGNPISWHLRRGIHLHALSADAESGETMYAVGLSRARTDGELEYVLLTKPLQLSMAVEVAAMLALPPGVWT